MKTMKTAKMMLVTLAMTAGSALANQAGKVTQITGDVKIVRDKQTQPSQLKAYDPVFEGDTLQTGADGRVKVLLTDDSVITLSPSTKLKVRQQTFSRTEAKRESFFDLLEGRLRAAVARYSGNYTNSFKVKTPTAVAGVRGSIQVVGTGGGQDFMACVEGPCTYGNPGNEVTLNSGEISFFQGGRPTPPRGFSAEDLANLINPSSLTNNGGNSGDSMPGADDTDVEGAGEPPAFEPLNVSIKIVRDRPRLDLEPNGGGRGRARVRINVPFVP